MSNEPQVSPAPESRRRVALLSVAGVALLGAAVYGAYWALVLRHHESTDNAYVQAPLVQVTPQVGGTVLSVLAELLEFGLRARGYRFTVLRNGREALQHLRTLDLRGAQPLLLLDVDLPGLDGYSVFDALQKERPDVYKVVFTTVHGTEDEQLRGLEAGALDYLVKPISLRVALEKIRRWVGR